MMRPSLCGEPTLNTHCTGQTGKRDLVREKVIGFGSNRWFYIACSLNDVRYGVF